MINTMATLKFPEKFLWGAATSSHQVEGNNRNDWSEWETKNADRLAREAHAHFAGFPSWAFSRQEAESQQNYISGNACDHYNRFREDFDIARSLHHNAHRFSIEWSRIEPREGEFDEKAIEHYRQVIAALRERGLEPFVTLWHWTLPVWLSEKGGIKHRDFPILFEHYAATIVKALGTDVKFWITLNEFEVCASFGYLLGVWPPQKKGLLSYYRVIRNLIAAHKRAYRIIKQHVPDTLIGIAKHQVTFQVLRPTFVNAILRSISHYFWNQWFLNRIRNCQDFIGLNYYHRNVVDNGFGKNPNKRVTDFGWEFYPESLYQALIELKPYGKPIYITENGLADAQDSMREEFIKTSLIAVHSAITDGADVRGYLHWSLLDNFEWDNGYWLRFGLVAVDRATQKRTVRPSALAYAKICETNTLETGHSL